MSHLLSSREILFTKDEYIVLLKLATMWDFQKLREATIHALDDLLKKGEELFHNGTLYHVDKWKTLGFRILISRDTFLTYGEMVFMVSSEKDLFWKYSTIRDCCQNKTLRKTYIDEVVQCKSLHYFKGSYDRRCVGTYQTVSASQTTIKHTSDCVKAREQLGLELWD